MNPRPLLLLEGALVFALSVYGYNHEHSGWGLFALLFLAPDISLIAYIIGPRAGAIAYNLLHTYTGPLLLAACAFVFNRNTPVPISLIWTAHIGFDRMLGLGLKYGTGFQVTHLSSARHRSDLN